MYQVCIVLYRSLAQATLILLATITNTNQIPRAPLPTREFIEKGKNGFHYNDEEHVDAMVHFAKESLKVLDREDLTQYKEGRMRVRRNEKIADMWEDEDGLSVPSEMKRDDRDKRFYLGTWMLGCWSVSWSML